GNGSITVRSDVNKTGNRTMDVQIFHNDTHIGTLTIKQPLKWHNAYSNAYSNAYCSIPKRINSYNLAYSTAYSNGHERGKNPFVSVDMNTVFFLPEDISTQIKIKSNTNWNIE
ncbi:hypothetical protein LJB95_03170, partial [Paludibacteraceae bacterium OttesenSCG-928-F17]|nr:hypothetical protein [Paludibacteraceae bacterium OttesenSCG-928-F17]